MPLPNDLSKETKAIVASNLTIALALLTTAGLEEKEAKALINKWYEELYVPPLAEEESFFSELSEKSPQAK